MNAPMSRARHMQESRKMRFEQAYQGWTAGRLTQPQAVTQATQPHFRNLL